MVTSNIKKKCIMQNINPLAFLLITGAAIGALYGPMEFVSLFLNKRSLDHGR